MKYFYSTESSSVPGLIAMEEAQIDCELIETSKSRNVNIDLLESFNPLSQVGTLVLDDGSVLIQNLAILTYLADLAPASKLLPPPGDRSRYDVLSWLAYSATDLQKPLGMGFRRKELTSSEAAQAEVLTFFRNTLERFLMRIERVAGTSRYVTGDAFTIADCHLYFTLKYIKVLLGGFDQLPMTAAYFERLSDRPSVQRAIAIKGDRRLREDA
ncbi:MULTISPECIES: glutathione S-transferase family protein [unclassified Chelatococcus]|uniref:glutathione S-transferase family protein n=1 Tax=unclassified Chelatococcus TaxID=2638111 RepID=UPI001BD134E4|nr:MULTISPECIES: glutathione S-transferase family protein [unclassified Chelatococcus]MBS7697491.1 glutathione S-transferase family protein [Chelatococcus sp. YT9]MBX3559434.1 glutathione S-transferase family protein [Chelatococcus sp.]